MKVLALLILFSSLVAAQTRSLKIATINVWSGLDYNGSFKMGEYETPETREQRFQILLSQIKLLSPNVIFLQEANPIGEFSRRLADSLSFDEIHQVCNAGIKIGSFGIPANLKEGIAILSNPKLNLNYFDTWKLSGSFGLFGDIFTIHFSESNFALVGTIKVNGAVFYLVNAHLNANVPDDTSIIVKYNNYRKQNSIGESDYREALELRDEKIQKKKTEFEELTSKLKELPTECPCIIGGDFNTASTDSSLKYFIAENKLTDAFIKNNTPEKYTWNVLENENVIFSTNFFDADGNKLKGYDILSSIYDAVPRRIDYIFTDHHFKKDDFIDYKIFLDSASNGIHASDHFGVIAKINLKDAIDNAPKEYDFVAENKDHTIEPLPIFSYDTDVGFGYGAKAFFLNLLGQNESFDVTLFNSTKGERWYRFVFSMPDFELRQGKIYPWALDFIIDYDKYIRNSFFGIGNKSRYDDVEEYTKEPLEVDLNLSRGFSKNFVGQFGIKYKVVRNFNYGDSSKLLLFPSSLSSSRVSFNSINLLVRYDTRNSFINPSKGLMLSVETEFAPKTAITNTSFSRYGGSFQFYSLLFYPKTIFALRASLQFLTGGDLPVQVLLPIGGNSTLRGYRQDRYLDKTSVLVNAELRFPVYWRFGAVLGMDAGKVWSALGKMDLKDWAYNPVLGLRFYMDTFVVRLDVGLGKETTGVYFNFGQIF